ncbi:MAG: glycosyl hydrolase family 30 [Bacteroidia bacterium]|nr:glycosyl hydrolase family 30 [Bacteroidia bacterium]NNF31758.1 glycoside hydrolase family 30 protein [Flavobacteriaceae bacterium]NNJ81347.1 glycoside hydrolase family 30 protein [Flavobacteriaceae bacterium]NNK55272.1 glycoside hydrolase family 30 protein [Flavobacteriaceae bacterium]NNM10267.1 glycoside hydrolase family 30 protein [Flavobacteriaceae bacterium]
MKGLSKYGLIILLTTIMACKSEKKSEKSLEVEVYETSQKGNKLTRISDFPESKDSLVIQLRPEKELQTITGFGGAFTESSAYLLNKLSKKQRDTILQAYFSKDGANYSLTRTHMNSCDFSLSNYSYASVENDMELENFTIDEDRDDLIPMIKDAMAFSEDGFKIFASPWTAPPWMKDNKDWVGGKLLPEYYDTWALFFSKYVDAYKEEGIELWGFTVENEPLGNGNNWESMHFTPKEMTDFVEFHLGPKLEADGKGDLVIMGYDQNREHLNEWVDEMYRDENSSKYFDGTAIHWYASTYEVFPDALQYAHNKAPDKYLIEAEGCIDAQVPVWQDDGWYWKKEATDWGYDWAPEEDKHLHPKYSPVNRYARDIIGCLNNWVDGWVDWNMVLDKQGGPNWFKNWCIAPVIVDPDSDEVYFTPLYYTMAHFSKYMRPGAKVIDVDKPDIEKFMVTAATNPDNSIAVVIFNEEPVARDYTLVLNGKSVNLRIDGQAIQSIVIPPSSE